MSAPRRRTWHASSPRRGRISNRHDIRRRCDSHAGGEAGNVRSGTKSLHHDKRLISSFVAELNLWTGASYEVVSWPDVDTRDRQAVDAVARDVSGRELAIEHT